MKRLKRCLDLIQLLNKKSHFLLGPRSTGKSSLIQQQLAQDTIVINLLKSEEFLHLSTNPSDLESIIDAQLHKKQKKWIVIDEIQKLPELLNEVHRLIEERHFQFLLTGSSARKLKQGHSNLLAGRAWTAQLFPLCWSEIPKFDLDRYLRYGGLPAVYLSQYPQEELFAYVQTYLYEEIQAEGFVRKIPQFSRFLTSAALSNGQLLNFTQIANDSGVAASTITEHYTILEDTLLGFRLAPWTQSKKRKAISTAKFYFFDTGIVHTLAKTQNLDRNSDLYGRSFEHWIAMELRAFLSYNRTHDELTFWRSTHQHEVDFIVENHTAIEVKATKKVTPQHLRGLQILQEESLLENYILVSHDPIETKKNKIRCLHWTTFIKELWAGNLLP